MCYTFQMGEIPTYVPKDIVASHENGVSVAQNLELANPIHRTQTVTNLLEGRPAIIGFKGIYGAFGDADNVSVSDEIKRMKGRDPNKGLSFVWLPEYLDEIADFSNFPYSHEQIAELQTSLYALGVVLPASADAHPHLINNGTVLSIHAEDSHFRALQEELRGRGGKGLAGTSANKAGEQTHFRTHEVYADFKEHVPVVLGADYTAYDPIRNRSTTIIRFEGETPILHREGNVPRSELHEKLMERGFPPLQVSEHLKIVEGRS